MSVAAVTMTRGRLRAEKIRLERALTEGWDLCDAVRDDGDPVKLARYEDRWIQRLGEYETVCDALASRA